MDMTEAMRHGRRYEHASSSNNLEAVELRLSRIVTLRTELGALDARLRRARAQEPTLEVCNCRRIALGLTNDGARGCVFAPAAQPVCIRETLRVLPEKHPLHLTEHLEVKT